jgi:hypothetical protein
VNQDEAYVDRTRRILLQLVSLSGLSRREIQRRLDRQGATVDVTRILRGDLDLKVRHLLAILGVLEIQPLDFFQLVFPTPSQPRSPLLQLFEKALGPEAAQVPTATAKGRPKAPGDEARPVDADVRRRMAELMREMEHLIEAASSPSGGR